MRLLTRSDFDGLICAVLLKEIGLLDSWTFVHPKDVQEGLIEVTENDILANVPYAPGVGLWFDHHASEEDRHHFNFTFKGLAKMAPSCARIIWEYYGGHDRFPKKFDAMMANVDKCDSGRLTVEDIENPKGWVLMSFIMDPRTGLGRYRDYRISNYQLMMELVEWCRTKPVEAILEMPDVEERVERYFEQDEIFREMIRKNATVHGNLIVLDLRQQQEIYTGNRFVIYTMFMQGNISLQIIMGKQNQNTVFTVGHSIINRSSQTDVGRLMLQYGGGGHRTVGTCQVDNDRAEQVRRELIEAITRDG
ncbi:MAG: exopolyphosphatase [Deltaproteobacteria bacterium]|nr:exopolyphosphatase [Deltaproteobacteria bacterium]